MEDFVQLHIHSGLGSPLDGVSSTADYIKQAKRLGHKSLATTDHGKLNNFFEHQEECLKAGIKPIFGVEAYVSFQLENFEEKAGKLKRVRNKNMHIIILVKDYVGYKNLLKLNYISFNDKEHYYYRNHITIDEIIKHKEGLIIGSGCGNSPFNMLFREGKEDEADALYEKFVDAFGDDFYTELQMNELYGDEERNYDQKEINAFELRMAKKYNRRIVLAGDVHYDLPGKDLIQTISIAVRNGDTIDDLKFEIESKNLYYHSIQNYLEFNKQWDYGYTEEEILEWCANTVIIGDKLNFVMPARNRMLLPTLTDDDDLTLVKKSRAGLQKIFNVDTYSKVPDVYKERLSSELKVILKKGMSSYLLIFEDIFQFVERNDIMAGVGRGSGAGSLILYCLNITKIDPIRYNLIFERFLSEQRSPDVVYDYFGEKY